MTARENRRRKVRARKRLHGWRRIESDMRQWSREDPFLRRLRTYAPLGMATRSPHNIVTQSQK